MKKRVSSIVGRVKTSVKKITGSEKRVHISEDDLKKFHNDIINIKNEMSKVVVGQEKVVDSILRAIISNGHVLLEGVPGIAKTLIMRALAEVTSCKTKRVQFTADLLPSDITGITSYERNKGFYVVKGPVFTNFLLADEINRAPAKVQSALLEAMQEKQVTIGRETFNIDNPFFVLATLNPIETQGSLTLNQEVFVNGKLMKGNELIKYSKKYGKLMHEDEHGSVYDIDNCWTYTLDGNSLERSKCMPYFVDYNDYTYTIKTRSGRIIEVTKEHPLLVNKNGKVEWVRAKDLNADDLLVSAKKIPEDETALRFKNHNKVLDKLKKLYKIVSYEDMVILSERTNKFNNLDVLNYEDLDKLRIYLGYSKKELCKMIYDGDKNKYYSLVRYLRKGTNNEIIREDLISFLRQCDFNLKEKIDILESYNIVKIKRFEVDDDIIFWLAFLLSDGSIGDNYLAAYQRNYPGALDKFISIAKNKVGCGVSEVINHKGCRTAIIRSKPLVDYIKERFMINGRGIPYDYIRLNNKLRKVFLKTFVSLEGCVTSNTITCVQKNNQSVNVLSYMLLKEGFLHTLQQRKNGIYNIRLRDTLEVNRYLRDIGWLDDRKLTFIRKGINTHRKIFVNPAELLELSRLFGITSFHAYKNRKNFLERNWYCAYKSLSEGRKNISVELFNSMLKDLRDEFSHRAFANIDSLAYYDPHQLAVLGGISINEIGDSVGCSPQTVWRFYNKGTSKYKKEIVSYLKNEFIRKLIRSEDLLTKYENLISEDIFFDGILDISKKEYNGKVFGLSVPKYHNYLGGFGACGINHNTFNLPEAQIDRFMFKLFIDYPSKLEEREILQKNITLRNFSDYNLRSVAGPVDIIKMQQITQRIYVSKEVEEYIVRLIDATRNPAKYNLKNAKYIRYGSSPRATISLYIGAKADALMNGKDYVTPQNIKNVAHDVLRHRLLLNYEGQAENINKDDVINEVLAKVPVP